MSLILEALRKSEAERRRGRMPDLHAELPPLAAPRAAPPPAWRWLAGSGVLVALALAVWLAAGMRTRAATTHHDDATPVAAPIAHAAPALPPVTHLQPAATPMPARTPTSAPAATVSAPAKDTAWPEPPRPLAPAAAAPTLAMTAPANIATPARPLPPPPAAASSSAGGVFTLSDLAPAERKALPPLKMSMHLWNDDASQRFVILDGNRLGEGDRIGDAVVTSITRDGVLLDWNGRTLKVPLR